MSRSYVVGPTHSIVTKSTLPSTFENICPNKALSGSIYAFWGVLEEEAGRFHNEKSKLQQALQEEKDNRAADQQRLKDRHICSQSRGFCFYLRADGFRFLCK